jgi:hypothetical protein
MRPAQLDLGQFGLPALLDGCIENLLAVYDRDQGLFPYSTRLIDGRFVNDYEHPQAIRYTINTLLGLAEAARAETAGLGMTDVEPMFTAFLDHQSASVETPADLGLLALLVSEYFDGHAPVAAASLDRLETVLSGTAGPNCNIQDLGWTIWGACAASRRRVPGASAVAAAAFDLVRSGLVDPSSGLSRHSTSRYRRNIVSFGGVVYYLRAMHEYARTFDDEVAAELFTLGVGRVLDIQGPLGEWPWMIDPHSGMPIDVYPVFSVHQDSMSMLFLLPALDAGTPRAGEAIVKSLAWGFGANELSIDFYPRPPFHAYRSIERSERAPRLRRYVRGVSRPASGRPVAWTSTGARLNPECRSYHLGWILYAWAGRPEVTGSAGPSETTVDAALGR